MPSDRGRVVAGDKEEIFESIRIGLGISPATADLVKRTVDRKIGDQMVIKDIMRERNVGVRQAYAIARTETAKQFDDVEVPEHLRGAILEALYRGGSQDTNALTSAVQGFGLHANIPDVLAAVWKIQKQGWVKFRENHTGRGSQLFAIRLTPAGRSKAIELRGNTPRQATERTPGVTLRGHSDSPRQGATHAAGVDGTDFRNHRRWNRGEEPDREKHAPIRATDGGFAAEMFCSHDGEAWPCKIAVERGFAGLQPAMPEVIPTPRPPVPLNQNEKPSNAELRQEYTPRPLIDEEIEGGSTAEAQGKAADKRTYAPEVDTHTQYPSDSDVRHVPSLDSYPALLDLTARAKRYVKIEAAVTLLDEGGEKELAMELLTKISLNTLETQVLEFLRALAVPELE